MTTIHDVSGDFDYLWINLHGSPEFVRAFGTVRGRRTASGWAVPSVEIVTENRDRKPLWVATDCPHLSPALHLLLSQRAVDALSPLIGDHGEFLPVKAEFGVYAIFNCFSEIDALDPERTEGKRFDGGGFYRVSRYELNAKAAATAPPIFRVRHKRSALFATDALREAVAAHHLTGFVFQPIWSSESGGIPIPEVEIWDRNPSATDRARAAKCRALIEAEAARGRRLVHG